jgi:four helix bundle protein
MFRDHQPERSVSPSIRSFRDLKVWNAAVDLAVEVHQLVRHLPRADQFRIGDQLARAATSVAANIAEGYGRRRPAEFIRFIDIANGSRSETETLLEVCVRLGLVLVSGQDRLASQLSAIGKMLTGLRRSILTSR